MLFLKNRTNSDPYENEKSQRGARRFVEESAPSTSAAVTAGAGAAAATAAPPSPTRSRRPFARVASWLAEVPAESSTAKAGGAGKPPSTSTSTSSSSDPPLSPLPLPSLPRWQRLLFSFLVLTRTAGTNDKVLIMRTLTQEVAAPGAPCNGDYLAKRFREARCSTPGRDAGMRALAAAGLSRSYWKSYAAVVDRLLPGNYRFLDARVRFFDATVREATSGGGEGGRVSQVVALAAGYDSRATRFLADPDGAEPPPPSSSPSSSADNNNSLRAFEVDLPEVVAGKRRLLEELLPDERRWPRPELVAADLSDAAAARETLLSSARGFEGTARTVFTAEGLFMYLPRENSLDLLREMGKVAAKGSLFAFDFLDAGACGVSRHEDIESKKVPPPPGRGVFATLGHLVAGLGEPFLDAFPSDLESQRKIAQGTGWKVKEVLDPSEIQKRFFPGGPGGERERGEVQKRRAKVPVVSRTNGFACWEKA